MKNEIFVEKLKKEGFPHVYEWQDAPGTEYPTHSHKGKVSFYVTEGCVTLSFKNGKELLVCKGERFDMLPGVEHQGKAGPLGCSWVVGEEIEGDA